MSTETDTKVEPPKTEAAPENNTPVEPEKKETPKQEEKPKTQSLIDSLNVVVPGITKGIQPDAPKQEEKKDADKPPETPEEKKPEVQPLAEEKKDIPPEPKKEEKPPEGPKMSDTARQHFARLESERDQLRERVKTLESKISEQQKLGSEEAQKKLTEQDKLITDLRTQLRAVAVERDPEFIDRYDKPREARMAELNKLAKSVDVDDLARVLESGDQDRLADIREQLKPRDRITFDAHLQAIENLGFEKKQALLDNEKTAKELEDRRVQSIQQQAQQYIQENVKVADTALEEVFSQVQGISEDTELRDTVRNALHAAAGATEESQQWDTKQVLKGVAFSLIQNKILLLQSSMIEDQKKTLAELTGERDKLKKDLEDRDSFIKDMSGGIPRTDSYSGESPSKPNGSLLDNVRIVVPGMG